MLPPHRRRRAPKVRPVLLCAAVTCVAVVGTVAFLYAIFFCSSPLCMGSLTSKPAASLEGSDAMAQATTSPLDVALTKAKALVAQNPLMVFSKSYCPFCMRAKKLFKDLGAREFVLELDEDPEGDIIQNALRSWTGQRTVPNVFIGGKHIGGCDDSFGLHKQGKLVPLLKEAGALREVSSHR